MPFVPKAWTRITSHPKAPACRDMVETGPELLVQANTKKAAVLDCLRPRFSCWANMTSKKKKKSENRARSRRRRRQRAQKVTLGHRRHQRLGRRHQMLANKQKKRARGVAGCSGCVGDVLGKRTIRHRWC